jgi:tyrosine phenol-lyase
MKSMRETFMHGLPEPFKVKMVEPVRLPPSERRKAAIEEAGYNTFLLRSDDVYIDLLTDSGTSAMSDDQWAGMMLGDESYAGSRNFYHLEQSIQSVLGFPYVVPTHQGRGAEHLLSRALIRQPGLVVPRNMYFTTSKEHVELQGASLVDVIIDEAHDPEFEHPFKGNIDLRKLEAVIEERGSDAIAFVYIEMNCNMAGGQPVSIANVREVSALCKSHGLKLVFDATRSSENAFFIKEREPGYAGKTVVEILRELMGFADACVYSAKKDALVNIGGFLATRDQGIYEATRELVVKYEGLHTYGGMAGRDMEAVARGLKEGADYDYLRYRIGQTQYLGRMLIAAGVPIVRPVGSHAVYLNALKFCPHIPRGEWPAQTLAAALYEDSAVRAMERGAVSKGRDKATGENVFPPLELVRLTIPRRVYTNTHMEFVADSIAHLHDQKDDIRGLEMVHEPPALRFFQARFKPARRAGGFVR